MKLDYNVFRQKVNGCFTGKAVGGTLGMPFEGHLDTRVLTGYTPEPTEMVDNDDLDLQVINLEIVRRYGLPINRFHLSNLWKYIQDSGPDEYGVARWNVNSGRPAPLSGCYCNKFYAGMGGAIRSELWACLAPGDPDLAVLFAREDACTDHYADGVHASMFLTAVESAAFIESDCEKLIEIGLSYLPEDCRLTKGLRAAHGYWDATHDPYEARKLLLDNFYVQNWTDVTINLCLIEISWLASGGDFSRAICTAGGLGYDADCTCATLGSIMGIIDPNSIGEKWTRPIGNKLVVSVSLMGLHESDTIGEFRDMVVETATEVNRFYDTTTEVIGLPQGMPIHPMHKPWAASCHAVDCMIENRESLIAVTPLVTRVIFPEKIAIAPLETAPFKLILGNPSDAALSGRFEMSMFEDWAVKPSSFDFALKPGEQKEFDFAVTAPLMTKRRLNENALAFDFTFDNGLCWSVSANLPVTTPWLRTDMKTGKTEQIEVCGSFHTVPAGAWHYATTVKLAPTMPVRFGVFSNRPFSAALNGETVSHGDGSFYVPAFHRGKTQVIAEVKRGYNTVDIDLPDAEAGELFFGLARPQNCGEWLLGVEYKTER